MLSQLGIALQTEFTVATTDRLSPHNHFRGRSTSHRRQPIVWYRQAADPLCFNAQRCGGKGPANHLERSGGQPDGIREGGVRIRLRQHHAAGAVPRRSVRKRGLALCRRRWFRPRLPCRRRPWLSLTRSGSRPRCRGSCRWVSPSRPVQAGPRCCKDQGPSHNPGRLSLRTRCPRCRPRCRPDRKPRNGRPPRADHPAEPGERTDVLSPAAGPVIPSRPPPTGSPAP
jgi:hypothetical protein